MTRWLTPTNVLRVVVVVGALILGAWIGRSCTEPVVETRVDSVAVDRTISERDTVTQTEPELVYWFLTETETDTMYVEVPTGYRYMGTIEQNPVDISGRDVTLTYQRGGRYYQNVYQVGRPTWRIDLEGDVLVGPGFAMGTSTAGLARRTPIGWLRLGGGYGLAVTERRLYQGPVGRISLTTPIYSWP